MFRVNETFPFRLFVQHIFKAVVILVLVLFFQNTLASEIIIYKRDAVVWLHKQTVTGKLSGFKSSHVTVSHNGVIFSAKVDKDSSFSFDLLLLKKRNVITVNALKANSVITSDTLELTLGYAPLPVVKPYASLYQNRTVLHALVIENPTKKTLTFLWTDDSRNPVRCNVLNSRTNSAKVVIPLKNGVYYFNLLVTAGKDSVRFQTYINRTDSNLRAFNLETQYADWIDKAVIYEITPSYFVKNGTYDDIKDKLPELKTLGVNTIWLQPVNKNSGGGQGYDITDYFSLRPDLGTEAQLHKLIRAAKILGMHVLFDFVPNHTSIHHAYVKNGIKYGRSSHYYNFYQHNKDSAPYASYYHVDSNRYIYYFWKDLVNLNYDNEEVQRWMIEACKYWIKEFDIDGYRFDAVWGVNARAPLFAKRLRTELKSLKPDLLLLAEDKGADKSVYQAGFDFAYDWTADSSWVSHWSWQYEYDPKDNLTIFNFPAPGKRGDMLRKALFENNRHIHRKMHFLENNDLPKFITDHGLARTKMAAALLFSLPGIPLIYCGQETGFQSKLYSGKPIFRADTSIKSLDRNGLFGFYQNLIQLRASYSALRDKNITEVPLTPSSTMVAFKRENEESLIIVIINLHADSSHAVIDLGSLDYRSGAKNVIRFTDVLSGDIFKVNAGNPSGLNISMKGYSTRWLMLNSPSLLISNR